ncbi:RES domain-containing protein [Roseiarcus sp.]|uniref:RES domain-containing protein n=1 Tax=Roseiarcus sp. TaxID=1969460 RepID=UPI003F96040D
MLAWRICRRAFADLSGEGARRLGGRWNSPDRAVVYAADAAALAVLKSRFVSTSISTGVFCRRILCWSRSILTPFPWSGSRRRRAT